MGKSKKGNPKNPNLGRSLIKGQNKKRRNNGDDMDKKESWLHTSEVQDGDDWGRLNLKSVTDSNTLNDFLETAELAGVEFTAEKLNVRIVGVGTVTGVLGEQDKVRIKKLQEENKSFITIPRRPAWDSSTSAEELSLSERDVFLNWRRSLALLQEKKDLLLTPYEKNLDIWRQLWRVIERSDVICQIVDARNPLLFKCDDLEAYVRETNKDKDYIVLINKADYLTEKQRSYWLEYFKTLNTKVLFWSALLETDIEETKETDIKTEISDLDLNELEEDSDMEEEEVESENESEPENNNIDISNICNTTELIPRKTLLKYFRTFEKVVQKDKGDFVTIGLVGYPNVGKSSTINALLQEKKTAVSATPGKTKHFQTHFMDESLCLCDCPGLVFPSFISTKGDMVLNGILPIDQLRDHVSPTTILAEQIPRTIIESTYGINIAKPGEGEEIDRPPTAEELLSSYAKMRGYMTSSGLPDCPRASRYILKDYLRGKLLYCFSPPGISDEDFIPCRITDSRIQERFTQREEKTSKMGEIIYTSEVDKDFFAEKAPTVHYAIPTGAAPRQMVITDANNEEIIINKPWKKHNNKNKKEKMRRIIDKKNKETT